MEEIIDHENEIARGIVTLYECLCLVHPDKVKEFEAICKKNKIDMKIEESE
jgi:hypothetical protein